MTEAIKKILPIIQDHDIFTKHVSRYGCPDTPICTHNSLTDALTNYSVPAEKLLNAVYYLWQEQESENSFKVSIIELKQLIGWDANGNNGMTPIS